MQINMDLGSDLHLFYPDSKTERDANESRASTGPLKPQEHLFNFVQCPVQSCIAILGLYNCVADQYTCLERTD